MFVIDKSLFIHMFCLLYAEMVPHYCWILCAYHYVIYIYTYVYKLYVDDRATFACMMYQTYIIYITCLYDT